MNTNNNPSKAAPLHTTEAQGDGLSYEQAMQRLETLAAKMERNEISLDDMAERLREAQQLMKYCRECLYEAEKNCKSLLSVEEKS